MAEQNRVFCKNWLAQEIKTGSAVLTKLFWITNTQFNYTVQKKVYGDNLRRAKKKILEHHVNSAQVILQ